MMKKNEKLEKEEVKETKNSKKGHITKKKKFLIVLSLIVLIFIAYIGYTLIESYLYRSDYIISDEVYSGEYDLQWILEPEYDREMYDYDIETYQEDLEEYNEKIAKIQNYDNTIYNYTEYVDFCNEFDLSIEFSNEDFSYIIILDSVYTQGNFGYILNNVVYNENTVQIYKNGFGEAVGDCVILELDVILIIPTENNNIEEIEVYETWTSERIRELYYDDIVDAITDIIPIAIAVIVILGVICVICIIKNKKYGKLKKIILIIIIIIFIITILFFYDVYYTVNHSIDDKPIIYLYPEEKTEIIVNLGYSDLITCSYPKYTDYWNVLAYPNGDLVDLDTNRTLYSLYYESTSAIEFKIEDEGFIVAGEDTAEFLEEKLEILGLNQREAEEFIIYWLPILQENEYNYIRFATYDEIEENMPLEISPTPDTLIRILMTYKGLDEPIEVTKQILETPERTGFVAVEWGGTEIK